MTSTEYICPGETHPISRSVHLSRLAAFFPACRDCPFRDDTGHLPLQTVERLKSTERRVQRPSLLTKDGVRGVYLNEISRKTAESYAAAFAGMVWECRSDQNSRPSVVVGHDHRPSAPDIATGVMAALRRMGCDVTDVGLCTKPLHAFAVRHFSADAGVLITGAGCDPSWTGFDFFDASGLPISRGAAEFSLNQIEKLTHAPPNRPTRIGGLHRVVSIGPDYEHSLRDQFHALRPLTVICGVSIPLVRALLTRLFEPLPCELILLELPDRVVATSNPADPLIERMSNAICERQAHVGILLGDDAQQCQVFDETGAIVSPESVLLQFGRLLRDEHPLGTIVVESDSVSALRADIAAIGQRLVDGGETQASLTASMRESEAHLAGGASGRFWFAEPSRVCDGIFTLAKLLSLLSLSDAPLSAVVRSA